MKKALAFASAFFLAGLDGIEPSRRESKSRVLPLDYSPMYGVGDGIRTHDLQCHKLTR